MAVDWSKAPPWAKFTALDIQGARWWYAEEPTLAVQLGIWTAGGGRCDHAVVRDWETSLEARHAVAQPLPAPSRVLLNESPTAPRCSVADYYAAGWTDELLVEHGIARWAK